MATSDKDKKKKAKTKLDLTDTIVSPRNLSVEDREMLQKTNIDVNGQILRLTFGVMQNNDNSIELYKRLGLLEAQVKHQNAVVTQLIKFQTEKLPWWVKPLTKSLNAIGYGKKKKPKKESK